jgi:hypothetical protein
MRHGHFNDAIAGAENCEDDGIGVGGTTVFAGI